MHTLALTEQGAVLHADGDLLVVQRDESVIHRVRAAQLDQLLLFGQIELSSGAIALIFKHGIDCVFLTARGSFRGRLIGRPSKNASLRLVQYQRAVDPHFCLAVARAIVAAKIKHQREVLLRAQRRLQDEPLALALGQMRLLHQRVETALNLDIVRGLEGQAAAEYFGQFDKLLRNELFRFERRSRRPPKNPVNACLSFGYAVLGAVIETEILRCGLDPQLGFFHQPEYGRPSLMLDLLEQFRPMIDQLVLRLFNRRQLGPADFDRRSGRPLADILADDSPLAEPAESLDDPLDIPPPTKQTAAEATPSDPENAPHASAQSSSETIGVYLNHTGRKIFLNELFRRLRERLYFPPRQASLELRDIIREQIYQLARVIEGKQPDFIPFVPG